MIGKCDEETDEAQVFRLSGFISDNGKSPGSPIRELLTQDNGSLHSRKGGQKSTKVISNSHKLELKKRI